MVVGKLECMNRTLHNAKLEVNLIQRPKCEQQQQQEKENFYNFSTKFCKFYRFF